MNLISSNGSLMDYYSIQEHTSVPTLRTKHAASISTYSSKTVEQSYNPAWCINPEECQFSKTCDETLKMYITHVISTIRFLYTQCHHWTELQLNEAWKGKRTFIQIPNFQYFLVNCATIFKNYISTLHV